MKLPELVSQLNDVSMDIRKQADRLTSGSKKKKKLHDRANGINYTIDLMADILRKEMMSKIVESKT